MDCNYSSSGVKTRHCGRIRTRCIPTLSRTTPVYVAAIVLLLCALCNPSGSATPEEKAGDSDNPWRPESTGGKELGLKDAGSKVVCDEEDKLCQKDKKGYEYIKALHHLLDDDQNGNVDQSESDEFLRDELQYTDNFDRHKMFHGNDKLINVSELWKAWKSSEVYNWTVEDVVEWLDQHVELPQYAETFQLKGVDGPMLPRLAVSNNTTFISSVLGIKNPVHKQKLALKAMDVVLFGSPKKAHSRVKDLALVISLVVALGGCWFAFAHHRYSQNHVQKMMKDLEALSKAEEALSELQTKLQMAEQRQDSVTKEKAQIEEKYRDEIEAAKQEAEQLREAREGCSMEEVSRLKLAEAELVQVRSALKRAEKELEFHQMMSSPAELQAWLQLTHEIELQHFNAKRQAAERHLLSVKEECERIRKRSKAFLGTLRMAHGNSLDDIDQRILDARGALEDINQDAMERSGRWHAIESLCAFPIVSNPGLSQLRLILQRESINGTASVVPAPLLTGPIAVDDADEDLPPSYPAGHNTLPAGGASKAGLRFRVGMGSTGSLSRLGPSPFPVAVARRDSRDTLLGRHGSRDSLSPPPAASTPPIATPPSSAGTPPSAGPAGGLVSGGVSFHLGDNAASGRDVASTSQASRQEEYQDPVHSHDLHSGANGLSETMAEDVQDHRTFPVSQSMNSISPSSSEASLTGAPTRHREPVRSQSTSALRKLHVDLSPKEDTSLKLDVSSGSLKKKKKKPGFLNILRKGSKNKPPTA